MSFLNSFNISGSGLTATRMRMDIIAENMTNSSTTRTEDGGPYRRKMVVYKSLGNNDFSRILKDKMDGNNNRAGVVVDKIIEDQSDFNYVYNPSHPDADEDGYVAMPNVNTTQEMIDFMSATRVYDMNVNAFNSFKNMASRALDIGR